MAGDDIKCLTAGCNDYTTKPIQRQHLVSMVAKYSDPAMSAETVVVNGGADAD